MSSLPLIRPLRRKFFSKSDFLLDFPHGNVGTLLDTSRVHFLGQISHASYRSLLQVPAAHIYLTYPFVLSWSMLEAMACGCLLIASRTPPICEVVGHLKNGLLVDFFDVGAIAETCSLALEAPRRFIQLRQFASRHVWDHYSSEQGIYGYTQLIDGLGSELVRAS